MMIYKNKGFYILSFLLIVLLVSSCGNSNQNKQQSVSKENHTDDKTRVEEVTFNLPDIPITLTDGEARMNYLINHYWDKLNYNDTTIIHNSDVMDQAFVNYIDLLNRIDKKRASDVLKKQLQQTIQNDTTLAFYNYFQSISEQYLYYPNSPMRNEELYLPVIEFTIENKIDKEAFKERARYIRSMLMKNRIGEKAENLKVKLNNGTIKSIYDVKSNYTILYFYNPDCPQCQRTKTEMVNSSLISELLKSHDLTILAIYPDEDLNLWKSHVADFPNNWIVSYDYKRAVEDKGLYHLRAIPSLYLLDKEHKVLLKDADFYIVEKYLFDIFN